ncbi:MAG TPA: hypothetical protein VK422_11800 [Pyrinomonadaceae bacterium]|nr:hypothetical protein [Pyrinomonadaceae bacterium]
MSTDRFTEILNYLSAMSREIGTFRTETNNRLAQLESRMGQLETKMDTGFEEVNRRIRLLHHKFEYVHEDLMEVKVENRDLRKRVEVVEKKVGIEEI